MARARGRNAAHPEPRRASSYERLERALRALRPPAAAPGWQARVLAALDGVPRRAARRPRGAGLLAAALLALVAAGPWRRPTAGAFERPIAARGAEALSVSRGGGRAAGPAGSGAALEAGSGAALEGAPTDAPSGARAGEHALEPGDVNRSSPGESLVVRGWVTGEGELRVYRERHELVLRCPGDRACGETFERGRRWLEGRLTFGAPGRYRAVLLAGARPPAPAPEEGEAKALRAASGAGARVVDSFLIEVR